VTAAAPDAVVVGSGPNGLAAAIELARAGRTVRVYEADDVAGGGLRSAALTLPGYVHDVCAAIHGVALASPFLRTIDLEARGVTWVHPDVPIAHPLDGGRAAILHRSTAETARRLGDPDGRAWRRTFGPLVRDAEKLEREILGPVVHVPRHPLALARFGLPALRSAVGFARTTFRGETARALFGGIAAHSMVALEGPASASFGLVLGFVAHAHGWPLAAGGSGTVAAALLAELAALGGEVETGRRVTSLDELPRARATILDVAPRHAVGIAGDRLAPRRRRALERFRLGPGIFKIDWALSGPIPWTNDDVARAGTVHVGGTLEEIAAAEHAANAGRHPDRPFVLLVQPTRFDASRAPAGHHTAWAYCHVPTGSTRDMTAAIEAQVERFAPGFRDLVLARSTRTTAELEAENANHVGGDINVGKQDLRQLVFRPFAALDPYRLGAGVYLSSSATPPGGGAHGMSGFHAARSARRHELR
jgi:phytoene dehydrogenase-like protein